MHGGGKGRRPSRHTVSEGKPDRRSADAVIIIFLRRCDGEWFDAVIAVFLVQFTDHRVSLAC